MLINKAKKSQLNNYLKHFSYAKRLFCLTLFITKMTYEKNFNLLQYKNVIIASKSKTLITNTRKIFNITFISRFLVKFFLDKKCIFNQINYGIDKLI